MIQVEMIDRMIQNLRMELESIQNTIESTLDELTDLKEEIHSELNYRSRDLFNDEGYGGTD